MAAATWTLKLELNGDIRRLAGWPMYESTSTVESVHKAATTLFGLGSEQSQSMVLRYFDDEGDLCSLTDATLPDALALAGASHVLRLMLDVSLSVEGILSSGIPMQTEKAFSAILSRLDIIGGRLAKVERMLTPSTWIAAHKAAAHANDRNGQFSTLEDFLSMNRVSQDLSDRMKSYLYESLEDTAVTEEDCELLGMLPIPMRKELMVEMHLPTLKTHPLFELIDETVSDSHSFLMELSTDALQRKRLAKGETLFSKGRTASNMFFIASGELEIKSEDCSSTLSQGMWCSEPSLWTLWEHRVTAVACTPCEILELPADTFREVSSQYVQMMGPLARYAAKFMGNAPADCSNDRPQLHELVRLAFNEAAGKADRAESDVHSLLPVWQGYLE